MRRVNMEICKVDPVCIIIVELHLCFILIGSITFEFIDKKIFLFTIYFFLRKIEVNVGNTDWSVTHFQSIATVFGAEMHRTRNFSKHPKYTNPKQNNQKNTDAPPSLRLWAYFRAWPLTPNPLLSQLVSRAPSCRRCSPIWPIPRKITSLCCLEFSIVFFAISTLIII